MHAVCCRLLPTLPLAAAAPNSSLACTACAVSFPKAAAGYFACIHNSTCMPGTYLLASAATATISDVQWGTCLSRLDAQDRGWPRTVPELPAQLWQLNDQLIAAFCNATHDTVCAACTACPAGTYIGSGCTGNTTQDSTCALCDTPSNCSRAYQ